MKKIVNPWSGYEGYFCFGCAPENPYGLHMEFYEDGDDIVSHWKPTRYVQGWIKTLHGGIQATLMDEIGAHVVSRKLQTTGVTSKLNVTYLKSISTDEPELTIRSRMTERKRNAIFIGAEIMNSAGEPCSTAEMVYFVASPEKARDELGFCGCHTEDEL